MANKMDRANEIASKFKIRCSAIIDIMGEMGLTEKQETELNELTNRLNGIGKDLTENQKAKQKELFEKSKNRELPEGAKTYCKKWLKNFLYGRYSDINSKYIRKGNSTEEDGFTLMATELNLGMVYKNTERKSNEWIEGECDLHIPENVFDNKASYSLDTFPMFETVFDRRYWMQLQGYGELWKVPNLNLCYTLNDDTDIEVERACKWIEDHNERYKIAERMIFTKEHFEHCMQSIFPDATLKTFIPIPDEERIKHFKFQYDANFIEKVKDRVLLCREYIITLLTPKLA